ncbi:MAG: response regulator [Ginsengibacter sp.]
MKKILVVNNDFDTMTLLKNWLEKKTYQVKYTGNGNEVPVIMKEFAPELVIVDVLQKEVALQLKANEETNPVPVLLMTGYTLKEKNNSLPVDDVIEKPFNLPLLEKKIDRLMRKNISDDISREN